MLQLTSPLRAHGVKLAAACFAAAVALTDCGSGSAGVDAGTLRLSLTDAPACGHEAVNVTIEKVRLHARAGATAEDPGWSELLLVPPRRVDLLTLPDGALSVLGQTSVPAGRYTQLRLVLAQNGGASPLANSVVPRGEPERPLGMSGDLRAGSRVDVDIRVAPEQMADFVVGFDACRSVHRIGDAGQYLLEPVVSVLPLAAAAGGAGAAGRSRALSALQPTAPATFAAGAGVPVIDEQHEVEGGG
jgi:hypothetical protein